MYTTRSRAVNRKGFTGSGMISGVLRNVDFTTPGYLEGVYSWRTGARNVLDPPGSPPLKLRRRDGFGLITPSDRGSLLNRLASRKQYLEDFQRAAFPAETDAGGISTNRTSTTDSGHLFGTLKVLRTPYAGTLDVRVNSTNWWNGDVWSSVAAPTIYNAGPYDFGFPNSTGSPLVVAALQRQAQANRYFTATAPDRKGASIGTTLIELIRGDVPSLLKNFHSMMGGYKTVRNYAGSEFLNIQFGWTPLIQEYANLIQTGMALERVVYYESFRRKRQWDGPSMRQETTPTIVLGSANTPYLSSSLTKSGETPGGSSGYAVSYTSQRELVAVEDYHYSSKYTGLAKAGRRANSFSDQAMDVAKRMGVVDDPEMLWDLTPYSWLVDWFTTMGESIHNAQTYSPSVGKYSVDYAFMTTKHTVSVDGRLLRRIGSPLASERSHVVTSGSSIQNSVAKWRTRATPFGFGTQLGSLSGSQFAILVALGLAKTR